MDSQLATTDTRQDTLNFIAAYRALPVLWDARNPEYMDPFKKRMALEQLQKSSTDPAASITSILKRVHNMRFSFRKELKKVQNSKKSGMGADQVYHPSLWYFEEMLFLADQEIEEHSISTFAKKRRPSTPASSTSSAATATPPQKVVANMSNPVNVRGQNYALKLSELSKDQLFYADQIIQDLLCCAKMGRLNDEIERACTNILLSARYPSPPPEAQDTDD